MKKILILIFSVIVIMGLFSFFNKEKKSETSKIILGMILLEEPNSLNIKKVVAELREKWNLKVDDKETSNETSVIEIDGYKIAIANMNIAIPGNEIETTAEFNYLWKNGKEEANKHKGHIILSIMDAGKNPVEENKLYTKIVSSVLNNSKSIGVYIGGRTLLLKKDFYQSLTQEMSDDNLPLYNWIYFGIRTKNGLNSMYTYGLADFNKTEIEILNTKHSIEETNEIMLNLVNYILVSDITLKNGETIGFTEEQKLKITISKGQFIEGKSIKVEF
jgi:hypothetical protein